MEPEFQQMLVISIQVSQISTRQHLDNKSVYITPSLWDRAVYTINTKIKQNFKADLVSEALRDVTTLVQLNFSSSRVCERVRLS